MEKSQQIEIVVYTAKDYSTNKSILADGPLTKNEIQKLVDAKFDEWYYFDVFENGENENWIPVKGFEENYSISNFGNLVRFIGAPLRGRMMAPCIDISGYRNTTLRQPPNRRAVRIHTLVAENFIPIPDHLKDDPTLCINHLDGDKLNNHVDNLQWTNAKGNLAHAVAIGLHDLKGEKHPNAKMTKEKVKEIRRLYATGKHTQKELGNQFGISRRQAGDIINRKNWGWLD